MKRTKQQIYNAILILEEIFPSPVSRPTENAIFTKQELRPFLTDYSKSNDLNNIISLLDPNGNYVSTNGTIFYSPEKIEIAMFNDDPSLYFLNKMIIKEAQNVKRGIRG